MANPKVVRGALPCGNPKRYNTAEVVQMQRNEKGSPRLPAASASEDQSESDQYLKTLLKRQIHTDVTLNQVLTQHRDFIESSSHAPSVSRLHGLHSIDEHVGLDEFDSTIEYLKSCGLTTKEIAFTLKDKLKANKTEARGYCADPASEDQIVQEIKRKLTEKEESLNKPDTFNGGLKLSRQALVLEKAILERQNKEAALPKFLFREKELAVSGHPDDPINHIPSILSDIERKPCREPRRERRRKRKLNQKLLRQQKYLGIDSDPKAHDEFMDSVGLSSKPCFNTTDSTDNKESVTVEDVDKHNSGSKNTTGSLVSSESEGKFIDPPGCMDVEDNEYEDTSKTKKKKNNVKVGSRIFTIRDVDSDVPLVKEEDIQANRLCLSEILSIDKFQHYTQGNPSKTVFVKNLPNTVTEVDLISLFGRFERPNASSVLFRLLNGRMKGQAFITFPDIDTAKAAITDLNGYKLHGRPMILSFGKKQNELLPGTSDG